MKGTTRSRVQESSPFHIALLSRAKICGLSRYANLEIRTTRCLLPSVVKDRRSVRLFLTGTSPLPAEREIGFGAEVARNKKPGNERRASPSFSCGCAYPGSLRNGCARFSLLGNPVLVTNFTSGQAANPVCQDNHRQIRGTPTSRKYSKELNSV